MWLELNFGQSHSDPKRLPADGYKSKLTRVWGGSNPAIGQAAEESRDEIATTLEC